MENDGEIKFWETILDLSPECEKYKDLIFDFAEQEKGKGGMELTSKEMEKIKAHIDACPLCHADYLDAMDAIKTPISKENAERVLFMTGVVLWLLNKRKTRIEISREGMWQLHRVFASDLMKPIDEKETLVDALIDHNIKVILTDMELLDNGRLRICYRWLSDIPQYAPKALVIYRNTPLQINSVWDEWDGLLEHTQALIVADDCFINTGDFDGWTDDSSTVSYYWDEVENLLTIQIFCSQ